MRTGRSGISPDKCSRNTQRAALLSVVCLFATLVQVHEASASRSCNHLRFVKGTTKNSTLLALWTIDGNCAGSNSWRAGSGLTTDPCEKNKGWLPNGWYDSPFMDHNYAGNAIRGRVWRLSDKACGGIDRTELFIHTEETSSNRQICTSASDDDWCWDGYPSRTSATNDYASEGCIKIRRASPEHDNSEDLVPLHYSWHNQLGLGHESRTDALYVYNP